MQVQSEETGLKKSSSLLKIGPITTRNKLFSIHTPDNERVGDILGWTKYVHLFKLTE